MLLSGTFVVVVNEQTVLREKREDWSWFHSGAKTPGIPLSKEQWFSLLTAAVMARNSIHDKCSHCLNVQANKLTVWGKKSSAQNNACNLGKNVLISSGNMRQSYMTIHMK